MDLGVPVTSVAQHLHWDWTRKLLPLVDEDLDSPFGSHRLMGIRCRDEWQALALYSLIGHHGRLAPGRPDLLYLEYLEVAPWNLKINLLGQQIRALRLRPAADRPRGPAQRHPRHERTPRAPRPPAGPPVL